MFLIKYFRCLHVYLNFMEDVADYSKNKMEFNKCTKRNLKRDEMIVEGFILSGLTNAFLINEFMNYAVIYKDYFSGERNEFVYTWFFNDAFVAHTIEVVEKKFKGTGRVLF